VLVDELGERTIVNLTRATEPHPPARLIDLPADCLYVRSRATDLAPLLERKGRDCLVVAQMPPCDDGVRPAHVLLASEPDLEPRLLDAPWSAARRVAGERLEWVVITRGARGVVAHGAERSLEIPAPRVTPVDTTGSGDAFAAGLVHALVGGSAIEQALETGAAWGAENARWDRSVLPAEAVERLLGEGARR
jgi:sugar/nucleoside kinase (ribokinase family)